MGKALVLHMGFLNTPYTKQAKAAPMTFTKAFEKKRRRGFSRTMTAEKVANILEGKYGIVEMFQEVHEADIAEILGDSLKGALVAPLSERRTITNQAVVKSFKAKSGQIEKLFRSYLDHEETGATIKAADKGKRTGRISRAARPPFINSGIYRASFRAWIDVK